MADPRVSQKGTKTRARQATHGRRLVTDGRCPDCASRHINRTISENGQRAGNRWCAQCGAFFDVDEEGARGAA